MRNRIFQSSITRSLNRHHVDGYKVYGDEDAGKHRGSRIVLLLAGTFIVVGFMTALLISRNTVGAQQGLFVTANAPKSLTANNVSDQLTSSSKQGVNSQKTSGADPDPSGTQLMISTNTDNGVTSTEMTVDGQQVTVPTNGSSHQTMNSSGQTTTVTTTNSQSTVGTATNNTNFHTNISVHSSSTTATQSGGSTTIR